MKRVTALLMTLALMVLMAVPALAQGGTELPFIDFDLAEQNDSGITGYVMIESDQGQTVIGISVYGLDTGVTFTAHIHAGSCSDPGGITYPLEHDHPKAIPGEILAHLDSTMEELLAEPSALEIHLSSDPSAAVACGDVPVLGDDSEDDTQDDQQLPDNQQAGGGKGTVTKTFKLTITGDAPEGTGFYAYFVESPTREPITLVLCGDPELGSVVVEPEAACKAGVYTKSAQVAAGTNIKYGYIHTGPGIRSTLIHEGTETLDADMTNEAFYTFGKGTEQGGRSQDTYGGKDTGAGDDQQDDTQDDGASAGDDQQVPDNQQDGEGKGTDTGAGDDKQDDTQDDQQGEIPERLPETGAGGLAPVARFPISNAVAGLIILLGTACPMLWRRQRLKYVEREDQISRKTLLAPTRRTLALLAVLLLLCGLAFPDTARAQGRTETFECLTDIGLPENLAELDHSDLQLTLQELVAEDPEAAVTLLEGEFEAGTVRADVLLADEALLTALLEGQPVNLTLEYSQGADLPVIVDIEVSPAEDCTFAPECVPGIELPPALASLDVEGLRAALEEMISVDADETLTVSLTVYAETIFVRADFLQGLADPVLDAVLAGDPLLVTVRLQGEGFSVVGIALLDGPECGGPVGGPGPEPKPGDIQDDQQGSGGQDSQQGDFKPTARDNQQAGGKDTGAGKAPDNQQSGGGATVTKTFELTLNGTVPEGETFAVRFGVSSGDEGNTGELPLCGEGAQDECTGDGADYSKTIYAPAGAQIDFEFERSSTGEVFHDGTETITANMTNTAWYTFGKGTGAGDEEEVPDNQQYGEDKDSGAGDDQQDDTQDDTSDNQQGEMPEELPDSGAGGLAPGASIPVGNAAAGLPMLMGAGYAVLRRR